MRSPGFALVVILPIVLPLVACASDPDRGGGGGGGGGSAVLKLSHPNPIVSRGAQVFSMPVNGNQVVNGAYHNGGWAAGKPTAAMPSWVAIKLAAGPTRILVSWDDGGTYNYKDPAGTTVYGLPADYHFEVSPDSTNGADGAWTPAGPTITGNTARTRAHALDFAGMTWIKMVITAAPPNASSNGVQIGEIDVHDISATGGGLPEDTWFFLGDSITAFAYDRRAANQPSFAASINTATGMTYMPATINGGIGGENTTGARARLDQVLAENPDYHFFAITYGTNDGWDNSDATTFRNNLQMMIEKLKAAGRVPVLSRVPFSPDGHHAGLSNFNAAIDELTATNQLPIGPDLYAHFMAHPEELSDMVHPTDVGQASMNRLWAEAMRVVYP